MESIRSPRRRVTSTDVAREAQLSRTTVSYVLNGTPHQRIPDSTRQRVFDAASRLGYAPSAAARTLRSGRSDVVLCLLPDWPIGVVMGRMLEALSRELEERGGLTLLTHPAVGHDNRIARVLSGVSPDAVITFSPLDADELSTIEAVGVPVTLIVSDKAGRNRVRMIDQRSVGQLQVQYLYDQGHRVIGVAVPDDPRLADFANPRLAGVAKTCSDLGIDEPVIATVSLNGDGAAKAVDVWTGADPKVTAVCAYNDEVAFAVLSGMRERGLRAPKDLAVIGVDDIPTAPTADPPLTSVVMDIDGMSRIIADSVIAALAGKPRPRRPSNAGVYVAERESA